MATAIEMGLPNINIVFREAGIYAIRRGQQGVVALILKDTASVAPQMIRKVTEIPEELSEFNKDQLNKAFLGYQTPPRGVFIYVQSEETEGYDTALDYLETQKWDWLAIPEITESETSKVATWIKQLRKMEKKKVKAVLPNTPADHEGIVNFTTDEIKVGERVYTTAEYCGRIAGLICGTPLKISCTYAPLAEVDSVKYMKREEQNAAIDKGEFILIQDDVKVKVGRGINSFVTTMSGKINTFKKIKIVEAMDLIHDDIKRTAEDNYVGKYPNSYDNKVLLMVAIQAYFEGLALDEIVAEDVTNVTINLAKQINYLRGKGVNVENMKVKDIKEADTGSNVFLLANTKILDAIEDIDLEIVI